MPIYEYECDNCGHKKEAIQKVSDAPLTHCPECDQETLRKLVSAAGFRLSGTGWYETDFKDKKDQKKLHTPDSKPAETTAASSEKSTGADSKESKPASKPAASASKDA